MKQYLLYLCAATLLFSCNKSDQTLPDEGADGKMHFAADIPAKEDDWSRATRGSIIDNTTITDFGVYGFHTGLDKWVDVSSTAKPNKMSNVEVTRTTGTNDWTYTPPVAWNGGDMSYFTFFGYAPYATAGNGITPPAYDAVAGTPSLGFFVGDKVPEQVDLLVAKPVYNTVPVAKVKMQFAHALSCINFKAFSLEQVAVSKIQITGVKYKGNLDLDGAWHPDPATKDFAITYSPAVEVTATTTETAVDLYVDPDGFFLLPQDLTSNASAKIIFTFTIAGGAELTKEYVIKEEWKQSKRITYTVDLTTKLEAPLIVTKVSITDWGEGINVSGKGDGEANEVKLTYNDGGTEVGVDIALQNGELQISRRPASPIQTWNTKPDGSGDYYGEGDMIIMKASTTLYNVDNTVTIGGMRWLRGNLSGKAGEASEYYVESSSAKTGMFFKWCDGWVYQHASSTTDGMLTQEGSTDPQTSYTKSLGYDYYQPWGGAASGDPCKQLGNEFMTPTTAQWKIMIALGSLSGTYRGVSGSFFGYNAASCTSKTIAPGCIFLPFAGVRNHATGDLESEGLMSSYWAATATASSPSEALNFYISPGYIDLRPDQRNNGLSVRCVSTDVNIDGVNWTTANLEGNVGTATGHRMATAPQDYGNFFKWGSFFVYQHESNRSDGGGWGSGTVADGDWNGAYRGAATSPSSSGTGKMGYDYVGLAGRINPGDPCQKLGANYKTPTTAQWQALTSSGALWSNYNNIPGRFFGPSASSCNNTTLQDGCIFLPASGTRSRENGVLFFQGDNGFYWSSSVNAPSQGRQCLFSNRAIDSSTFEWRGSGLSVRCVRED